MKYSDLEHLFPIPWAFMPDSGTISPIPKEDPGDGSASLVKGFPKATMTPLAAGGKPPRGENFNGILNMLSRAAKGWESGAVPSWNNDFAQTIGGYPQKAQVTILKNGDPDILISLCDNNLDDPNGESPNWGSVRKGLARSKDYLPLSGGTLTGNLSGTTAGFSGLVTAKNPDDIPGQNTGNNVATTYWSDKYFQPKGVYVPTDSAPSVTNVKHLVVDAATQRLSYQRIDGNWTNVADFDDIKAGVKDAASVGDIKWRITDRTPPAGDWIVCAGQNFDTNIYPELAAALSRQELPNNVIPNLTGRYVKSFGAGTPGPGRTQEDAIRNITGGFGVTRYQNNPNFATDAFYISKTYGGTGNSRDDFFIPADIVFDASRVTPTAEEIRPKTIILVAYIKAR